MSTPTEIPRVIIETITFDAICKYTDTIVIDESLEIKDVVVDDLLRFVLDDIGNYVVL